MINKNTTTIKVDQSFVDFLNKAQANMIIAGITKRKLSNKNICNKIEKYFKMNNEEYLEFIELEDERCLKN